MHPLQFTFCMLMFAWNFGFIKVCSYDIVNKAITNASNIAGRVYILKLEIPMLSYVYWIDLLVSGDFSDNDNDTLLTLTV